MWLVSHFGQKRQLNKLNLNGFRSQWFVSLVTCWFNFGQISIEKDLNLHHILKEQMCSIMKCKLLLINASAKCITDEMIISGGVYTRPFLPKTRLGRSFRRKRHCGVLKT